MRNNVLRMWMLKIDIKIDFFCLCTKCVLIVVLCCINRINCNKDSSLNNYPACNRQSCPTIIPEVNALSYKVNDTVYLSCESDCSIEWLYPKLENRHTFGSHVNVSMIEKRSIQNTRYRANLAVYGATYADTGFYYCREMSSNELARADDDAASRCREMSKIYVYVSDSRHPLVFWQQEDYNMFALNTSTLSWCRPTAPNISIALEIRGKQIVNSENASHPFSYDPRYGFSVDDVYKNLAADTYTCRALHRKCALNTANVLLTGPPSIEITIDRPFYKPGDQLLVQCRALTRSLAEFRLIAKWHNETAQEIVLEYFNSKFEHSLNITAKRSGTLRCVTRNNYGNTRKEVNIFVTDVDNGCDVWNRENSTSTLYGDTLTLECGVAHYKNAGEITWYSQNGTASKKIELGQNSDHTEENSTTEFSLRSKLIIRNIKYNHTGNYECRINDSADSCAKIDVSVHGKPLLSCDNITRTANDEGIFRCTVESNPSSETQCFLMSSTFYVLLKGNSTKTGYSTTEFSYNVSLNESERTEIQCVATNKFGNSSAVVFTDFRPPNIYETNLNNSDLNIDAGQNLALMCFVKSIQTTTVTWKKNNEPWRPDNSSHIKVTDNNQVVVFSRIRTDDQGKYSCVAVNHADCIEKYTHVHVKQTMATDFHLIGSIVAGFFIGIIMFVIYVFANKRKKQRRDRGLRNADCPSMMTTDLP